MARLVEESGVHARIIRVVGQSEFVAKGKKVRAKFYLMECLHRGTPTETRVNRDRQWRPFANAMREVEHDANKALLAEAERLRKEM